MKDFRNKAYWAQLMRGKCKPDASTTQAYIDVANAKSAQEMNELANENGGIPTSQGFGTLSSSSHAMNPYSAETIARPSVGIVSLILTVSLIIGMVCSIFLDQISRGPAHSYISQHCYVTQENKQGFACRATEQEYGWPLVVTKTYTDVRYPNGEAAFPDKYTTHTAAYMSRGGSLNALILGGAVAVTVGLIRVRMNVALNRQIRESEEQSAILDKHSQ